MRVAIIGGTRFLGRAIVKGLLRRKHEVISVHRGQTSFEADGMKEVFLDKNDRREMSSFFRETDLDAVMDTILQAEDLRFIIPLLESKIGHYVHCGSTGVYTPMEKIPAREDDPCDPPTELGGFEKKLEQDKVLLDAYRDSGFPATIMRPTNIQGPGDIPLDLWGGRDPNYFRRISRDKKIIVPNDGRALLQPGYVEELGDAFCLALENPDSKGQIYNISRERSVTLNSYLSLIMNIMGSSSEVEHLDLDEILAQYPEYFESGSSGLRFVCEHMCVDISKAKRDLGFHPRIDLEEALRRNLEWMRERDILDY